MWNNRRSQGECFTVPVSTNVPDTPEFNKINAYVLDKFSKMVFVVPQESTDRFIRCNKTHNMYHDENDKSMNILPIIKKYVATSLFDRSGYKMQELYDCFTVNKTTENDKAAYFNRNIKPLVASIYKCASEFTDRWGVSSDPFQRSHDEENERCKRFMTELMKALDEDEKLQKSKEPEPQVIEKEPTTPKKKTEKVVKEPTAPKKKKKPISATIKKLVWNTHIGEEIGKAKCLCCNVTDITQMSFNCGHIVAEANGGETIVSNLKPICQNCNSSMGTKNMNDFMKSLK